MGMMFNRRRVCGGKIDPYAKYTLIHHWEASDGIVNGGWIDRIQGKVLTAYGNPQLVDGMFKLKALDVNFQANLNSDIPVNMGNVWQVDVEFLVESVPSEKASYLVDFGSLYMVNHAFGFSVSVDSKILHNPKLTGNNSAALYETGIPFSSYGVLSKASMGMEKIDDTTYLPYYLLNGERYNSPNTTTERGATFNGNFNQNVLYIGRGHSTELRYQSSDWKYIKSLKIYKKE